MAERIDLPMEDIVAAYNAGMTSVEIAKQYGVHSMTIRKKLKAVGVTLRPGGGNRPRWGPEWDAPIRAAYEQGETIAAIAQRFDISPMAVTRILHTSAIPMRPHGLRVRSITIPDDLAAIDELAALFDAAGTIQYRRDQKSSHTPIQRVLRLVIFSPDPTVIHWLQATFGGLVRWEQRMSDPYLGQRLGLWYVYRIRDIVTLLRALLPRLHLKRVVAAEALAQLEPKVEPPPPTE